MSGQLVNRLRTTFRSGVTRKLQWRKEQLISLRDMTFDNQEKILSALHDDLRKPRFEGTVSELGMFFEEVDGAINNLETWAAPKAVSKPNFFLWTTDKMYQYPQPYGVMLLISPWNYPFGLTLVPLVGMIAAGNCAIIKPSEVAPHSEQLLKEIIPKYLDDTAYSVVTGGVTETTELLTNQFDHIMYTGSTATGKIVMEAAAKNLTSVTLELGGKSPCIIDNSADLGIAARRIAFGKLFNSGQSCISPDYVLIDESVQHDFIEQYQKVITEMHGSDPSESENYARIINEHHFDRLSNLLENCNIAIGGNMNKEDLYISPTVVQNVSLDHPVMQEEIFGPILPIVTFNSIDEAVEIVNDREKPLALYFFSTNIKSIMKVQNETFSGAFVSNDTMSHSACNTLPFGGVGASGIGAYHGKHSFDEFSHFKPCLHKFPFAEVANDVRMPPYTEKKLNIIKWVLNYPTQKKFTSTFKFSSKFFDKETFLVALLFTSLFYAYISTR